MSYRRHAEVKPSEIEWVEQIPVAWDEKRLRFLADTFNSNVDKKAYDDQVSVRLCNYTDVYYNEVITPNLNFMEATASHTEIKKFGLRAGDVIITKDSEDPRDIGVPAFVQEDMPGVVCGYHLSIIRTSDPITAEYVQFSIMSHLNKARLHVDTPGVTRFGLDQDTIKNILVLLPPPGERREIVRRLRSETAEIAGLIHKKTRFIALLKEKRVAVITHAVTKGIDPDAPMKDSGVDWLGRVPAHWTVSRLRFHVLVNPSQKEQGKLAPERPTSFFPMDAIGEKGDLDHSHIRRLDEVQSGYSYFAEGDVVVAKVTPCFENGKGAIMSGLLGDFGFGTTEITTLRPDQSLDKAFLYLLTSIWPFRKIGVSHMTGAGGLKRVPDDFFRNFTFGMPPMAEQQAIVKDVENQTARIDGLITLTERSIDLLREKRAALITAAVTGKIDVRAAA